MEEFGIIFRGLVCEAISNMKRQIMNILQHSEEKKTL